jgi:hypothetical protein
MARKPRTIEGQGSLFGGTEPRRSQCDATLAKAAPPRAAPAKAAGRDAGAPQRSWRMPELEGKTIAEIRLRWPKRLTPAQVARVEVELGALAKTLTKLGFGTAVVERTFVRRRRS